MKGTGGIFHFPFSLLHGNTLRVACAEHFGYRWEFREGFDSVLPSLWGDAGEAVKESRAKLVTRHCLSGKTYFIKRYRISGVPFRSFKYFFKPSNAKIEWDLAQRLASLGVEHVSHLALGEKWNLAGLQECVLITEGFNGRTLVETNEWDPAALRRFVDGLHAAGVLQRDLHFGNILYDPQAKAFCLVDLHGIVIRSSLTDQEKRENLAYLRIYAPIPVSDDILELSGELARPAHARRSRRCLRENRDFTILKRGGIRWHVRKSFFNDALKGILDDPDGALATECRVLKRGRSAKVGTAAGFVIKRYDLRRPSRLVKDLFRPSAACRAYRRAYHLELRGIPTARPVACGERRRMGFLFRSYFVMEEIPNAATLAEKNEGLKEAAEGMARLLARLHNEGFIHRDLKLPNLLFQPDGGIRLIDLDGLRYAGRVGSKEAASNLLRLNRGASRLPLIDYAIRFRFLRTYCRLRKIRPRSLAASAEMKRARRTEVSRR